MLDNRGFPFAIRLPGGLKWMVLAWLGAELLVFAGLVHLIGFWSTALLGIATTLVGIVMLRRIGTDALRSLRRTVDGGEPPAGALLDGMLGGLGAVLLILPGFIANGAGLALAAPSVRRRAIQAFNGDTASLGRPRAHAASPDVIDLGPDDWRPVDRG